MLMPIILTTELYLEDFNLNIHQCKNFIFYETGIFGNKTCCTSNDRPDLSSERALHRDKTANFRKQPSDRK
jgi:hypothetical protein